ncbi:fimbrial assembly protein [Morganella morganii]|uniref:Fimbrial assembly protein n=1 Tax=Morganella morganii TaxID=582 RepID=A0A433ZT71_MORMO|nr:fimbrial protein [Morganella morganii]RUT65306.1 fimbrial assembly protein [Morganella morganii]
MFYLKRKLILSSLVLLSVSSFADNDDMINHEAPAKEPSEISARISFRGMITDSSCAIAQDNKEVDLKEHSIAKLKKAGDKTEEKEFTISVVDCSLATTSLKIKMEGTAHNDNNTLFALDAGEESAQNVGIYIKAKGGAQMVPGGGFQDMPVTENSREHSVTYLAGYQATGTAAPGKGDAVVNYTVSYE